MKRFRLRIALIAVVLAALAASVPAFASERPPVSGGTELRVASQQTPASDSDTLHTRALWAVLGVAAGCAVCGVFYLAKKKAGHFDNPTWTAPISKMYSKDFPESFGDAPAEPHDSHH